MLLVTLVALCLCAADVARGMCVDSSQVKLPDGFTVHKMVATWEEARAQCATEGAVVASPTTTELLNAMRSVIGVNNTAYFIGTRSTHFSGSFVSQEGVPLDNMKTAVLKMIQQLDPHAGDCLSMDLYSIQVVPCCERMPYLCYKAPAGQTAATAGTSVSPSVAAKPKAPKKCPDGYLFYASTGSCYKKHTDLKTWSDASATCEEEGAHLVVVDDAAEALVIMNMNMHDYPDTYIGLHDYTGVGGWKTVNNKTIEEVYHEWQSGHPTGDQQSEFFCALMLPNGKIDDYYCENERKFVCEIEV